MNSEQDSLSVTSARARQVFAGVKLAPQQEASLASLLDKAMQRNAPNPVPIAELEGIKELVTEHLWHPELSKQLHNSAP